MTEKGGKSYHFVGYKNLFPLTQQEIAKMGFRIDEWDTTDKELFIKLTKLR